VWVKAIAKCDETIEDDYSVYTAKETYLYKNYFIIPDYDFTVLIGPHPYFGERVCIPDPKTDLNRWKPNAMVYKDSIERKIYGFVSTTLPNNVFVSWYRYCPYDIPNVYKFLGRGRNIEISNLTGMIYITALFEEFDTIINNSYEDTKANAILCSKYYNTTQIFLPSDLN